MAYSQFRQVGAPDQRLASLTVRKKLRTCAQRTGGILRGQRLPSPGRLLAYLVDIRNELVTAYSILPLHRLVLLRDLVSGLYDTVEYDLFHDCRSNGDVTKSLRDLQHRVQKLVHDLSSDGGKHEADEEATKQIRQFLEAAASRGWRVTDDPDAKVAPPDDGFELSYQCLATIAIKRQALLQKDQDFGVVAAPIVLINNAPIPEKIMLDWTQRCNVYVVYGMYVVVTGCSFIGAAPSLVLDHEHNVLPGRFDTLTQHLVTDGVALPDRLLPWAKRITAHYYCPVVPVPATQVKYFRQWDILTTK